MLLTTDEEIGSHCVPRADPSAIAARRGRSRPRAVRRRGAEDRSQGHVLVRRGRRGPGGARGTRSGARDQRPGGGRGVRASPRAPGRTRPPAPRSRRPSCAPARRPTRCRPTRELTLDVRALDAPSEQVRVDRAVRAWRPHGQRRRSCDVSGGIDRPADGGVVVGRPLRRWPSACGRTLGLAPIDGRSVGGASDGNLTAAAGHRDPRRARRRRRRCARRP